MKTQIIAGSAVLASCVMGHAKERKFFGRDGSGRLRMPGQMMTKAGKRMQMQKDIDRKGPRRGKRR